MGVKVQDNVVIVVDNSNYKTSYAEDVPFRAKIQDIYHDSLELIIVKSLSTNKEYELYPYQILEFLPTKEMKQLVNLDKYGVISD